MKLSEDGQAVVVAGDCSRWISRLGPYDHVITDWPYSTRVTDGARSSSGRQLAPWSLELRDVRRIQRQLAANVSRWAVGFMDFHHASALDINPVGGLRAVRVGVWVKPDGAPQLSGDRPAQGWEAISIQHAPRAMRWNGGGGRAVWTCARHRGGGDNPNEKPVELIEQLVRQFTDPGDRILDPFAGSGVVAEVAVRLGRRVVAIEKQEAQAEKIVDRLGRARAAMQMELIG